MHLLAYEADARFHLSDYPETEHLLNEAYRSVPPGVRHSVEASTIQWLQAMLYRWRGEPERAFHPAQSAAWAYMRAGPSASLRDEWMRVLRRAAQRGWNIVHLIGDRGQAIHSANIEPKRERKMRSIVHYINQLLGARGLYIPYLVHASAAESHTAEFILVPSVGALKLHATRDHEGAYVAELLPPDDVAEAQQRIHNLTVAAHPVYDRLLNPQGLDFSREIAAAEEDFGDRYLVMNGLSETTIPLAVYHERIRRLLESPALTPEQRGFVNTIWRNRKRR